MWHPKTENFTIILPDYALRSYPLCNVHKIRRIYVLFQDLLAIKIWMELLKGLQSYGGFKWRVSCFPQIFSSPSGETMHQAQKCLEVEERAAGPLSPCQVWWALNFARARQQDRGKC